jgi:hypothetical protein
VISCHAPRCAIFFFFANPTRKRSGADEVRGARRQFGQAGVGSIACDAVRPPRSPILACRQSVGGTAGGTPRRGGRAAGLARTSPGRGICRARAAACCPCTAAAAVLCPAATWDTLRWLLVHRHSLETSAQRTHIPARGSLTGSNFCAQCDTIQVRNLSSGRQRRGGRPRRQLRPPGGRACPRPRRCSYGREANGLEF